MSYRPSSLLPLMMLQLVRTTLSQLIGSSANLSPRALPTSVLGLVPDCTANCLDLFISANYQASSCLNDLDLTCLCTHNTPSGSTIGEAALECLISSCPTKYLVDESSVFNICSGIPNAIPETMGTITVTITSTNLLSVTAWTTTATLTSSTLPSSVLVPSNSFSSVSGIVFATGAPVIPTSLTTSSIRPRFSSSSTSPISSPVSLSADATDPSPSASMMLPVAQNTSSLTAITPVSHQQAKLTSGQIVGIAVAGGAVACFALGVLLFVLCLRKKKRHRRRSIRLSKTIENPPARPFTPSHDTRHAQTTFADPTDLTIGHGQRYYAAPLVEEKKRSFWRTSIKLEDIGVAVSPEIVQGGSPDSYSSHRTASQLLPALPNYALWPAPLRLSRQMPTTDVVSRPESTTTVFEEDVSRDMGTHKAVTVSHQLSDIDSSQEMAQRPVSLQIDSSLAIDPRSQMYALERTTAAANKAHIPLTPVYDNGVYTPVHEKTKSTSTFPDSSRTGISILPQPHYSSTFAQDPRRAPSPQANVLPQRSLQTYSSAPNLSRNQQQQHRRSASTPALSGATTYTDKRSTTTRKGSIDSAGSDITTFDTDDDATPEQELEQRLKPPMLSPVIESPARPPATFGHPSSPIKDLQYPRIPRPAAISRQAEKIPRPRASLQINPGSPPSQLPRMAVTRDQLVRDEHSFLQSQSSSQASSELSRSLLAKRRGDSAAGLMMQGGLKLNSDSVNRVAPNTRKWQVMNPEELPLHSPRKPKLSLDTRGSDVENERTSKKNSMSLTPTRRGRDLFLTVH